MPTYYAAIRLERRNSNRDLEPFEPKVGAPITATAGNVHSNFGFYAFLFSS